MSDVRHVRDVAAVSEIPHELTYPTLNERPKRRFESVGKPRMIRENYDLSAGISVLGRIDQQIENLRDRIGAGGQSRQEFGGVPLREES